VRSWMTGGGSVHDNHDLLKISVSALYTGRAVSSKLRFCVISLRRSD
jgi:hypothetical protein